MKIKKHFKKLIVILVLLMLFNFCCPKNVNARGFLGIDIPGAFSELIFWAERGILKVLNDIFCDNDETHKYIYKEDLDQGALTIQANLSPESIIKGKFLIFNANIFEDPKKSENADKYFDYNKNGDELRNGRDQLRKIVSSWYYALRNFAIIALLSVLVYVGIRMILSTLAQDKAKYKAMFKDWLVALCLLIAMHFILITVLNLSSMVVEAIGTSGQSNDLTRKTMALIANINRDSHR